MIREITKDKDIWPLYHDKNLLLYRGFINPADNCIDEAIRFFDNVPNKNNVSGKVGVAFESYTDVFVCNHGNNSPKLGYLQNIEHRIMPIFPKSHDIGICASIVKYNSLQGMTGHKDFSYNKLFLGTLVLDGELLYGSAKTRQESYLPSNMKLLKKGDLALLPAPHNNEKMDRPYFFVTSPTNAIISRIWARNPSYCEDNK